MRTAGLMVALAATFNLAFADIACKPEALHYKPRIITATEKTGFAQSIEELCSAGKTDKAIQGRFESTVFTITRTGQTFNANDCKVHFNSIIDECVAGKNMGGGGLVVDAMTLEVSTDASNETGETVVKRITKKPTAKKPAATKPAAKKPAASKPAKTPTKPAATPTPTPAGKVCALKPANGKKPPKKTLRSLVSKILGRASPAKPGSPSSSVGCLDEPMRALPGWGETFFGFRDEFTVSKAQLLQIAKDAYKEVTTKHPGLVILVAALYVPDEGVYLGTVPHGAGMPKMKAECPNTAPVLWEILGVRTIKDKDKSQSLYHAEDAAMWYAYKKGAVDPKKRFPVGSMMLTYGKIGAGGQATKIPACNEKSKSNIDRNCEQTMNSMKVDPA